MMSKAQMSYELNEWHAFRMSRDSRIITLYSANPITPLITLLTWEPIMACSDSVATDMPSTTKKTRGCNKHIPLDYSARVRHRNVKLQSELGVIKKVRDAAFTPSHQPKQSHGL